MAQKNLFTMCGGIVAFSMVSVHGAAPGNPSTFPSQGSVRFVGALTCQSSMCHGGASPSRGQFVIWAHQDAHSRAYATLATAYAANIAKAAGIESATTDARCTTCHAPLAGGNLASTVSATEGVSCEACHGVASAWLRSHTRTDLSYADKVGSGMRDLRDVFVRANTCVECHQTIAPNLIKAGHPTLTFDLDGQVASEPRHWKEKSSWFGAKAWLVGQAVALREITIQLGRASTSDLKDDQKALVWLFQQVPGIDATAPPDGAVASWSNQLAQTISGRAWKASSSEEILSALAGTSGSFTDGAVPVAERERRAERLAIGLDRVFKSIHSEAGAPGEKELNALFAEVGDSAKFNPKSFADALGNFSSAIKK